MGCNLVRILVAFEKKASDLSKELDIVRVDRDSLSRRFQDAKKKAAGKPVTYSQHLYIALFIILIDAAWAICVITDLCDAFDAIQAACDKFSIDNPTPDGVEAVTEWLGNFPELTEEAAAADGGHCRFRMQLALATRGWRPYGAVALAGKAGRQNFWKLGLYYLIMVNAPVIYSVLEYSGDRVRVNYVYI